MSGSDLGIIVYEAALMESLSEEATYDAPSEIPISLPNENFVWQSRIAEQNSTADYYLNTIVRKLSFADSSATAFQGEQENVDVDELLFKILARARFQEMKNNFFQAKTKDTRIQKALTALNKVKLIEGLNTDAWKMIAEDESISDQYGE